MPDVSGPQPNLRHGPLENPGDDQGRQLARIDLGLREGEVRQMAAAKLTVVVPTLRERGNIPVLAARLEQVLAGIDWEVVFVDDDSDDGSAEVLVSLSRQNPRIRFLRRIGRRGLSSACLEGMGSSAADLFAVIDADLQHDETVLREMLAAFDADPSLELAVGTRYARDGDVRQWNRGRQLISRLATVVEKRVMRTDLSDPMSGFFMLRRELFEQTARRMTARGFKILLDLVLSAQRPIRTKEFPYEFRTRLHGESKLDVVVALEYLYLLLDKSLGRFVPVRFLLYVLAGLSGLFLHLLVLAVLYQKDRLAFPEAQAVATFVAMVSNFLVNNSVTFRSMRLRGWRLAAGLLFYIAVCAVGAVVNVAAATYFYESHIHWWLAGVIGALIGAVWNYAVSTHIVWTWLPRAFPAQGTKTLRENQL